MIGSRRRLLVALLCVVVVFVAVSAMLPMLGGARNRTKGTVQHLAMEDDGRTPQIMWRKGARAGKFDLPSSSGAPGTEAEKEMGPPGEIPDSYEPEFPPPKARHMTLGGWPPKAKEARDLEKAEADGDIAVLEQERKANPRSEPEDFKGRGDHNEAAPPDVDAPDSPEENAKRFGNAAGEAQPKQPGAATDASKIPPIKMQAVIDTVDEEASAKEGEKDRTRAQALRPPPMRYLPRSAYFENTYLGGNAAVAERQHRLDQAWGSAPCPYRLAALGPQAFDPPMNDGLALVCSLDRTWSEKPGRVMLQIGLRGSDRYGWRRPPLDVIVIIDPAALGSARAQINEVLVSLVRQLGPQDKLGLTLASDPPRELAPPQRLRDAKASLAEQLAHLPANGNSRATDLAAALKLAGARLSAGAGSGVPGTQTILFIPGPPADDRVAAVSGAAHALSLAGVVTSVLEVGGGTASDWWTVAHAGQGNHHRVLGTSVADAVAAELTSLARVVARLARVNIRLGPDTKAIRILGSRILSAPEVKEVKDREVATDRQLSRSLGVASDRGEDDDGLQTVIPYFLGGDAHVILVELMVERPGAVAEISVRYKDMVRLTNAQVHATVALGHAPRSPTRQEAEVMKNAARFKVAERLQWAAFELGRGKAPEALAHLAWAARSIPAGAPERRMVEEASLRAQSEGRAPRVVEAIDLAADRLIGQSPVRAGQ